MDVTVTVTTVLHGAPNVLLLHGRYGKIGVDVDERK